MKKFISVITVTLIFMLLTMINNARSHLRKKDPEIPEITIGWKGSPKVSKRTDWHYTEYPIFTTFNETFFYSHTLDTQKLLTFGPEMSQSIDCFHINNLIEGLLKEIKKKRKQYTHFTILQAKNFNVIQKCGLLILKFNDYPFVLKLFIETPKTFIDPYCKGFENQFFFYMSGGINRHIAGLTRIKNLELVKEQIAQHSYWRDHITVPRKWYWIPKKAYWLEIKGKNIGGKPHVYTLIPGIYAIIADQIDTTDNSPLTGQQRSELVMQLCMDLHLFIDPHSDNFVIKYDDQIDQYHISIVDTEHFPSMVGLKEEPFFNNHLEWGLYLAAKYFQDAFLQTKEDLRQAQVQVNPHALKW